MPSNIIQELKIDLLHVIYVDENSLGRPIIMTHDNNDYLLMSVIKSNLTYSGYLVCVYLNKIRIEVFHSQTVVESCYL